MANGDDLRLGFQKIESRKCALWKSWEGQGYQNTTTIGFYGNLRWEKAKLRSSM